MEAAPPVFRSRRIRQIYNCLVTAMLLAGMLIPLLRFNRPGTDDLIRSTELRRPAPQPSLKLNDWGRINLPTIESLEDYRKAFVAWFSDHIGYRLMMTQTYGLCKCLKVVPNNIFESATATPGVISKNLLIGSQGRLFYNSSGMLDDFRGIKPFTAEELAHWKSVLEARHRWFASRGMAYILMVPPNAQTIYPECMPRGIRKTGPSRLDQLIEVMSTVPGFVLVDTRSDLVQAKQKYSTFYLTDTHWNDFGAFIGYRALIRAIAKQPGFAGLTPSSLDDFNVTETDVLTNTKDLARMLNLPFPLRDQQINLRYKHASGITTTKLPQSPAYTSGEVCENPAATYPTVLVHHDSFFEAMKPYFSTHFKQVKYVLYFQGLFPYANAENLRPAVVVEEMVERALLMPMRPNPSNIEGVGSDLLVQQPAETKLK